MPMQETMEEGMPMAGAGPPAREMPEKESDEAPMIYLTKDQLGGKDCKVGETLTLKATDVDPETGEVAFEVTGYGGTKTQSGGYEADFEEAVPEEE